jgi:phosphatidylserine/phosphatidylglycerophosphate/cardiolipin synthase-like enzyme
VSALSAKRGPPSGYIWIDARARIAHEKVLIVDRHVGSYNLSVGAAFNSEDLNVVTSPEVAAAYAARWQARQAVSVRFADAWNGVAMTYLP